MVELFGKVIGCFKGCGGLMYMFLVIYNLLGGYVFVVEGIFVVIGVVF